MFFINQLLTKALIKRARTSSVAEAYAKATIQHNHSAYVIKVLEASYHVRLQVKAAAIANVELAPSPGQEELVCILAMFETLSAAQKIEYIYAYKANASLAGHGPISVVLQNTWQNNHNPPQHDP